MSPRKLRVGTDHPTLDRRIGRHQVTRPHIIKMRTAQHTGAANQQRSTATDATSKEEEDVTDVKHSGANVGTLKKQTELRQLPNATQGMFY